MKKIHGKNLVIHNFQVWTLEYTIGDGDAHMNEELKTRFGNEAEPEKGIQYTIPTDGVFQVHWPNGQLRYEWEYKDGKRSDGVSKGWHDNGKLKSIRTYKNGKLNGEWNEWYESGKRETEQIYKDDALDVLQTNWFPSGQKKLERTFKDGKRISSKRWNEDGSVKNG